jgi:hypothetical protein
VPRQAAHTDRHLKRVASDADHWRNWLKRLAELRRASEGDGLPSPAENSPDHLTTRSRASQIIRPEPPARRPNPRA